MSSGFTAFVINFSYIILFAMPLALLLSRAIGIEGIWSALSLGNLLGSVLGAVWAVATGRRLETGITEPMSAAAEKKPV